jgi:hypothetical protein
MGIAESLALCYAMNNLPGRSGLSINPLPEVIHEP